MKFLIQLVIGIALLFPEAFAWQWLSRLILNPYGIHELAYGTCIGISIAVGVILLINQLARAIGEAIDEA